MITFQDRKAIGKDVSPPIATPTPKNTPALEWETGCKLATEVGVGLVLVLGILPEAEGWGWVFGGVLGPNPTLTPIAEAGVDIDVGGKFRFPSVDIGVFEVKIDTGVEMGSGRMGVGIGGEDVKGRGGSKVDCELDVIDIASVVSINEVDVSVVLSDVVLDVLGTVIVCSIVLVGLGVVELEDDDCEVKVVDDELDESVDVVLVLEVVD